jgi:hypothetical protein
VASNPNLALLLAAVLLAAPASASSPSRPTKVAGGGTIRAGFVRVGPEGAKWAFPGGVRLSALPGAELRVLGSSQPLILGGGRRAAGYTVIVRAGIVDVEVEDGKPRSSALILSLPRKLNAIVQSGAVRAVATSGASAIAVGNGLTIAAVGAERYRAVESGSVLEAIGHESRVRAMIEAPSQVRGGGIWLVAPGAGVARDLSWDPVEGARGYRIELRKRGQPEPVTSFETAEPHGRADGGALGAGEYDLSMFSIDTLGFASMPFTAPIRVVAAHVPGGGYVDANDIIRLGTMQKVTLSGTEGIEMTYGNDGRYFRGREGSPVGLYRDQLTRVHFRLPGSSDISSIKLAPRTVRAEVHVGPKMVTWPAEHVEIRVELVDPTGAPIPEWIEMVPRVMLGIEKLDVQFRRQGRVLHARVPPRSGAGPWVVRVEVEDQFGLPLGWDFVGVIRSPTKAPSRAQAKVK